MMEMFITNIVESIFVNITVTSGAINVRSVPGISTQHLICIFNLFPYTWHVYAEYSLFNQ